MQQSVIGYLFACKVKRLKLVKEPNRLLVFQEATRHGALYSISTIVDNLRGDGYHKVIITLFIRCLRACYGFAAKFWTVVHTKNTGLNSRIYQGLSQGLRPDLVGEGGLIAEVGHGKEPPRCS